MNNIFEIFINHNDWQGTCILNKELNTISRKNNENDNGTYKIIYNKLIIKWEKWDEEIFFCNKNNIYYYKDIYYKKYLDIYLLDNVNKFLIIIDKKNNKFQTWDLNINGSCILDENQNILTLLIKNNIKKKYKKINENLYFSINIENNFFELENLNTKFIFNKLNKTFINTSNLDEYGFYKINDNIINLKWNNEKEENFYFNNFYKKQENELKKEYELKKETIEQKLKIIKPNKVVLNNKKLLFGNVSLCKKNIILSSIYYRYEHFDINSLIFSVKTGSNKIINTRIFENNDYESSFSIILELENYEPQIILNIEYKTFQQDVILKQLDILQHDLSAMTLFKDDYQLLEKYLDYYEKLGIEVFFLYYNDKISTNLENHILELNLKYNNKYTIYLIEWDYIYMWKVSENEKHHFAQTMAINDSLNILKNYGNYILYNDLDEYFIMPNEELSNFNTIINKNQDIDIFTFKNQFCKMGSELIKYCDFYEKFDLDKIILGNYWDNGREKNLIKSRNINVMGVHKYFQKFNEDKNNDKDKDIKIATLNKFYHIINFEEKNREIYMTQYIDT